MTDSRDNRIKHRFDFIDYKQPCKNRGKIIVWTKEQLINYEGDLIFDRDVSDKGYAIVETLCIYTEDNQLVYTDDFYSWNGCNRFIEGLGF